MFGFIAADAGALEPARLERYRGCYCGLCRALKERHGGLSRLTLNYDMTFLVLLLTAMYEPEETAAAGRCGVHPVRRRTWWRSGFTDYAADMNVALAYFNCLDDWADDRRLLSLAEARALRASYERVSAAWPAQCAAIEESLAALHAVEQAPEAGPDDAANCFAGLMGALFVCREDPVWGPRLRELGEALGRFLYMMDACADLERDRRRGSYNPLAHLRADLTDAEKTGMLKMLIGECAEAFERLPIVQDADILRNILYSGVWTRYAVRGSERKKGGEADGR